MNPPVFAFGAPAEAFGRNARATFAAASIDRIRRRANWAIALPLCRVVDARYDAKG